MSEMTGAEIKAHIEEAIQPLDGPPIHERDFGDKEMGGYEDAAKSLALAMLRTAEDDPALLDLTDEEANDENGFEAADNRKLWNAMKEKYPGIVEWLGGPTGFQYGWAHNAVRAALNMPLTGNPAVMTIGKKGD